MGISTSSRDSFAGVAVPAAALPVLLLLLPVILACVVLVDVDLPCLLVMRKPKNHDPVGQTLRS